MTKEEAVRLMVNCIIESLKNERDKAHVKISELEAEITRLKNDLLDALDLKQGNGPTALAMLKEEIERLKESRENLKNDTENRIEELKAKLKGLDFAPLETLYTGMIEECKRFLKLIGEVKP